ncbi:MAG: nitroreductase family deazaflavin-dependent oxidoreductase [Chloroflexi bacterium]|nr:nitroreductase family deazaflavin-dependent oxidoreductase [Chloroflexota bacterium]
MNQETAPSSQGNELAQLYRLSPDQLRPLFKAFNKLMVGMFRLGLGPYVDNPYTGYIMVLTTIGRRSGKPRRAPVNYVLEEDEVYCIPGGLGHVSDWYKNLLANPDVQVWIGGKGWAGRAEVVKDPAEWLPIYRQILRRGGLPVEALTKKELAEPGEETLLKLASEAPLVRIRLERELPKGEGPGDLAWLWPVLGAAFLTGWMLGKTGKKSERTPK